MRARDYLDVYLLPADCALDYDDTPFEPGDVRRAARHADGRRSRRGPRGRDGRAVRHDLHGRAARDGGSIQPFDLDAELARLAPLAEEMWNDVSGADGGWFAYAPS